MAFTLHWSDYFIFVLSLVAYSLVGIYFRWQTQINNLFNRCLGRPIKEVKPQTAKEIFLGNRKLGVLPIMASTAASFFSAATLLGNHLETYLYGLPLMSNIIAQIVIFPMVSELYMPVLYKLKLFSVNQYFEMRFGTVTKVLVTITFLVQMVFYVGASLFAPALALSAMTNANLLLVIVGIGALTTFYTAMGGLKGVVWTDLIQMIIMFVGMLLFLIFGLIAVGGPVTMWNTALNDGKIDQLSFSADPFTRYTFWSLAIGSIGAFISTQASNQGQVQRYLSCKTLKTAKRAILLNIPIVVLFSVLHVAIGLVSYVYFRGCDPKESGELPRYEMLLPFLALKLFANIPVLRGVFLSVIFAAALSTISSGLNSLAAVGVHDVVLPIHYKRVPGSRIKPKRLALISRLLAVFLGFLTTGIAIVLTFAAPNILRIIISIFGATGGPIFVLHTLGIFFPFINDWGAIAGFICSVVGTMWMSIGGILRNTIADVPGRLPSVEACLVPITTTLAPNMSTLVAPISPPQLLDREFSFYDMSFLWLTSVAMLIGFVVASLVSLMSGMNTRKPIAQSLMASQAVAFYNCFPRCHPVQSYDDNDLQMEIDDESWAGDFPEEDKRKDSFDNMSLIMY